MYNDYKYENYISPDPSNTREDLVIRILNKNNNEYIYINITSIDLQRETLQMRSWLHLLKRLLLSYQILIDLDLLLMY